MKLIPFTNNTLFLTEDNEIVNTANVKLYSPALNNNNSMCLKFKWVNGEMEYDIKLVYLACHLDHVYPDYVFRHIEVFTRNKDTNLHMDNIWFRFTNPIEVRGMKDLYHIPYFSRYYINKTGHLYSTLVKRLKKYTIALFKDDVKKRTGGYFQTRTRSDSSGKTHTSRHRLLALAFKPYNIDPGDLYVNHNDGIPGNDSLKNIDWVTPSENLLHALANGLMPNSVIPISVKRLDGEVLEFSSIAEAARYLNWTHSKTEKRLHSFSIYPDSILIKRKDDVWTNIKNLKLVRMGVRCKVEVTVNNEVTIYNNIMEASRRTNVSTTSISKAIRGIGKSKVKGIEFRNVDY
ncbi:MAG: hypothetical protein DRP93_08825 [Candidatus Neomarinimicrobiota bacterium]|nr:MAG: hypothetical protein DRP93_08825 [Candidatus Neomarinimicrobiota bacterium]